MSSDSESEMHILTGPERVGLTLVTESGFLSLLAVCYVFFVIKRNIERYLRDAPEQKLGHIFREPMAILMFLLFFAEGLQAIGAIMDIRWVHVGYVQVGNYCDAQGIVQQLGETGVALSTLLIAIYTFIQIWIPKDICSKKVTLAIISSVWAVLGMVVIIGNAIHRNEKQSFQAPTPYWCWISEQYMGWRIGGEYFWFWLTMAVSFFIYIPLYLYHRGNINLDDHHWWKFSFQHSSAADPKEIAERSESIVMLAYPVAYCITVLPLSIVRWSAFVNPARTVSGSATFTVAVIYGLSGLVNVVLFLNTRSNFFLFKKKDGLTDSTSGRAPAVELATLESNNEGRLPSRSTLEQ